MSKHMQLTVTIRPYYKKGIESVYPEIARRLKRVAPEWGEEGPALFEIVKGLDKLLYAVEGDSEFKELLLKHRARLYELLEKIEEEVADWHLAKADQLLYKMEDIFDEIERETARL